MPTEVLVIDNTAHPHNRARLHAAGCGMLRAYNGKRGRKIVQAENAADLAEIIATLEEDGYPVKRCKCLPK